jgi:orotate phosphoribosyltransferase
MSKDILIKNIQDLALKKGDFVLASGEKSSYYIDLKNAYTYPHVMGGIVSGMIDQIGGFSFDRIAGLELGAVPIAVALSMKTDVPFVIVRKKKKGYGREKMIEGEVKKGENVLLVEDVVTSGSSLKQAAGIVRQAGGICARALAVVDRLEGAGSNLQKINIELTPLLTIEDLEI